MCPFPREQMRTGITNPRYQIRVIIQICLVSFECFCKNASTSTYSLARCTVLGLAMKNAFASKHVYQDFTHAKEVYRMMEIASLPHALEINRHDTWATHCIAHINEMTGEARKGVKFMEQTENNWNILPTMSKNKSWFSLTDAASLCFRLEAEGRPCE
ncbi:TTC38-like protein [Mya arenaria]|uniref:TTC38-like protein n=1 Tax=Mya arenaria TaxID=6604 RepID=A0ABY7F6Q2_MYAAR|nr:TTC38-like protein [Mya arenaria]